MSKRKNQKPIIKKASAFIIMILLLSVVVASATPIDLSIKKQDHKIGRQYFLNSDSKAFVLTTNYADSSFSVIDLESENVEEDIAGTHGDDQVRYYDGKIYVMNRFGYDCIEVFDADNNFDKVFEFSTGVETNPHDIAFISKNKAYVTCYDSTDLLIVNPTTGEHLGTIDLSEYADEDGFPEMDKMTVFNVFGITRVYVSIQRLNRTAWYAPTDTSYILEINGRTNQVTKAITLTGVNPFTDLVLDGIHLLVGEAGSWFALDGGIERINILTGETDGFIMTESELGGNILDFEIYPRYTRIPGLILSVIEQYFGISLFDRYNHALISDLSFNTSLVAFDSNEKTVDKVYSTNGYQLADMTISNRGMILLADRTPGMSGIRIFNAVLGTQETTDPIDVGTYPPVHITII